MTSTSTIGGQAKDLRAILRQCRKLLLSCDPPEGSSRYTWPASAEADLNTLTRMLDGELSRLNYDIPEHASSPALFVLLPSGAWL